MSDGSLSQDEIDALLQGTGDLDMEQAAPAAVSGGGLSDADIQAFQTLAGDFTESQASNMSMLIGKSVTLGEPKGKLLNRDTFIDELDDEIVEIGLNFKEGVAGTHMYVLPSGAAGSVAGLMMGQEEVELNEAALSALQEAFSQFNGPATAGIGDRIGATILTDVPTSKSGAKAESSLTDGEYVALSFPFSIEGENPADLTEIFSAAMVTEILEKAGLSAPAAAAPEPAFGQPDMAAMPAEAASPFQMTGGGLGDAIMGAAQPTGDTQQMFGQSMAPGMAGPNVQAVQFPGLSPQPASSEQGNIGLLMDVYMEMTVELGRTKKLIKEILGMGEGTIIELDKLAGEPVDILVNHKLIAKGEVVVIDENFGVRVTEIVSPLERMSELP
jgi:flagellar motor switch protein FliN